MEINLTRDKGKERQRPNKRNQTNQITFSGFLVRQQSIAVLGSYFSVRGFIAYGSVRVAHHRPAILTGRQSGTMILLVHEMENIKAETDRT